MTLTYTADTDARVAAERARQINDKGYTPEHDDEHTLRELAACADQRLADLIHAFDRAVCVSDQAQTLVEVRAVILALIESAERRVAAKRRGVTTTDADADTPHPFGDLSKFGLLWLINRVVFHPRGYALAVQREDDDTVATWRMLGNGTETWHFDSEADDDEFAKAEAFLNSLKPNTAEPTHG